MGLFLLFVLFCLFFWGFFFFGGGFVVVGCVVFLTTWSNFKMSNPYLL